MNDTVSDMVNARQLAIECLGRVLRGNQHAAAALRQLSAERLALGDGAVARVAAEWAGDCDAERERAAGRRQRLLLHSEAEAEDGIVEAGAVVTGEG